MRYFLLTGIERSSSGKNETTRGNTGYETKGIHNIHFKNVRRKQALCCVLVR